MRSPAEYYIRYRLVKEPKRPTEEIEADLKQELVFSPHKDYVAKLRNEMQIQQSFHPENLLDFVSQAFLRKYQIWTMWHSHRGTKEAVNIFRDKRARSLLQTLVASPNSDQTIFEVFIRRAALPLSDYGLAEFKHFFWNVSLLNVQELQAYVSTYLKDPLLYDVIDARTTPEHMLHSLSQIGVAPQVVDEVAMLESYRVLTYLDSIAATKTMKPGLARSTALSLGLKGVIDAGRAIREIKIERGEDVDNIDKYDPKTLDIPIPDLKQLGEGTVPMPVALLNLEEEPDRGQGTGGST